MNRIKNKTLNVISTMAFLLALGSGLASCRHKDLVYPDASKIRLDVVFDWQNAPDASPSSMAFYLYDTEGKTPIRFIFQNSTGGEIHVPSGDYLALCMNADITDWAVIEKEENINSHKISTLDATSLTALGISTRGIPRAPEAESERMATTPASMLYGYRRDDVSIPVAYQKKTITMYPEEKMCHYTVDVYTSEDMSEFNRGVDATLSGMAEGYLTGADTPSDEKVTHPFHLQADTADGCLRSQFLTFGEPPAGSTHYVSLYMIDNEGTARNFNIDVTDQVSNAADPRNVHIVIRGIDLPEPHHDSVGMGGFIPDVEDWQSVNIGLRM